MHPIVKNLICNICLLGCHVSAPVKLWLASGPSDDVLWVFPIWPWLSCMVSVSWSSFTKTNIWKPVDEGIVAFMYSELSIKGFQGNEIHFLCKCCFLCLQVLLNQIVLGPCVIAVAFAWNNLWQGKLSQLPAMYQKDALPTLLYGRLLPTSKFSLAYFHWVHISGKNFSFVSLLCRVQVLDSYQRAEFLVCLFSRLLV